MAGILLKDQFKWKSGLYAFAAIDVPQLLVNGIQLSEFGPCSVAHGQVATIFTHQFLKQALDALFGLRVLNHPVFFDIGQG
jgi:hypothetical protein